jgi:hypothetical protein
VNIQQISKEHFSERALLSVLGCTVSGVKSVSEGCRVGAVNE